MNSPATILFGISLIPAIVGLVEVLKDAGMPAKFSPLASVLFGVAGSLAQYYARDVQVIQYIVTGIALGLSSVGLYATASTVGLKSVFYAKEEGTASQPPSPPAIP